MSKILKQVINEIFITNLLQNNVESRACLCYKRKKNVTEDWIRNIPEISRQLEYRLHRDASSFEEYIDLSTLAGRLSRIMNDVSNEENKV